MVGDGTDFVIVYGALRSGTTMLRLMLDGHPKISCPAESDFLFDHLSRGADGTLRYDVDTLNRDRMFTSTGLTYPHGKDGMAALSAMIGALHRPGTTPVLMLHRDLRMALAVNPGVRIVHLLRDPRDVARSSVGMGWAGNVYFGVDHWIDTEREWASVVDRLAPEQVLTLRFGTLVASPEAELCRIAAFCGHSYDPAMLDYAGASTYDNPDVTLTDQWRRKLSPRDIGLVEAKVGALLQSTGFSPSGFPPIFPTATERFRLMVQNRRQIWGLKFERFGVIDPVLVGLSRRLRLPRLGWGAQARIDKKMVKYLK